MRSIPKAGISLALLAAFFATTAAAQSLPDSMVQQIDKLFAVREGSPGFTVGIIRNDSLIFAKGYGLANVEYNIPNTPGSVYHMASVSKQFTAYSILLLEAQGRLQLADDIRKHLPWFPDLKHRITIQHLLNHTSGIRDHWDLNVLSGRRMDDVITQDYLLTLLSRQQGLNFKPGEEFLYSNSNYTLMAEIVKAVSGQTFRRFADSAIFKPLGMTVTHVHDDHTEVVPNRAYSYQPIGINRYSNAVLNYANAGATSLFTDIRDMAKWVTNLYQPKIGSPAVLQKLTTKGVLNNGTVIPYASGIVVDEYNGKKRFQHNGADAGYRTFLGVFPEERLGFLVFSNLATTNIGAKAAELMNVFFPPRPADLKKLDTSLTLWTDTTAIARFMGSYIAEDGVVFQYGLSNGKVYWTSLGPGQLLARGGADTLVVFSNPDVRFRFSTKGPDAVAEQYWPGGYRLLKRYTPPTKDTAVLARELKEYTGTFYSPEVDSRYTFTVEKGVLQLSTPQSFTVKNGFEYIQKDFFRRGNFTIRFRRNSKGVVTGMELGTSRVRNLVFHKM
ncbi:MAG TPA: serine hydrolase domain-containing protein [Hymenobacter sp.]|nr:serine hydrolase domain-containing protein [Hymenobacter sp.]